MMKKWKLILFLIWIIVLIFPVFLGYKKSTNELQFSGLIFNPIDGYSYFAKMQQGASGDWAFNLTYSSQTNKDIYIFTLYHSIGHLSSLFGISFPVIYHLFRMIFSILLFFSLQELLKRIFVSEDIFFKGALISLLFGGGLGWIYFISGDLPLDFWVAEAYIFLSSFSNIHFVLTILIFSFLLLIILQNQSGPWISVLVFSLSLILVSISPFAAIMMGFVFLLNGIWGWKFSRGRILQLIVFSIPTVSIGAYQYLTIRADPILNNWNSQNLTQTPGVINLFLSFSPMLIGAMILIVIFWKKKLSIGKPISILIVWIFVALLMAYVPFNLQRRFLVGLYLPIGIVFWYLLKNYFSIGNFNKQKLFAYIVIGLCLPSSLLVFSGSLNAINQMDPIFYYKKTLAKASAWISDNVDEKSVILADEDNGLILPALANVKVVYGHPFESINAEETKQDVDDFWLNKTSVEQSKNILNQYHVDYILCEFNNFIDGCPEITQSFEKIYQTRDFALFKVVN